MVVLQEKFEEIDDLIYQKQEDLIDSKIKDIDIFNESGNIRCRMLTRIKPYRMASTVGQPMSKTTFGMASTIGQPLASTCNVVAAHKIKRSTLTNSLCPSGNIYMCEHCYKQHYGSRCQATVRKRGKVTGKYFECRCSRNSKIKGFCKQHYREGD